LNASLAGMGDSLQEHRPAVRLVSALFKLTRAGERPVEVERLAAVVDQPVEETVRLAHQIFRTVVVRDGLLDLRLGTASESRRFRLRIDGRVIDAEGCAVDLVWMAMFIDQPLQLEASCAATGRPIHVDLGPEGVRGADPPSTVVAVLDPAAPEIRQMSARYEAANDEVCVHQPFFASAEVAGGWLAGHPGGRLFPLDAFFDQWPRSLPR
jgi:alkylmercury lyase